MIKFLQKLLAPIVQLLGEERLLYLILSKENKFIFDLKHYGYLKEIGWVRSVTQQLSIDKEGKPIPWNSYSYIQFITPRLKPHFKLFEYGSGFSSLYYSSYLDNVVAVESDPEWYDKVKATAPSNLQLHLSPIAPTPESYIHAAANTGQKFDIIVIDGMHRPECVLASVPALSDTGILVLDDSNMTIYSDIIPQLRSLGFRNIDFWGLSTLISYNKATSIWYRTNNILEI